MPKFTHLHVHTHYSLLDGLAKIDDLLDHAKELGMESIAITDHGVLYGAVEFFVKAKERGLKPIIGCEFYITAGDLTSRERPEDKKRYHLILLAKNETGYKNLMRLISIAHLQGFYYKPRIDKKILKKHAAGLIALSACAEGEIPTHIIMGKISEAEKLALEYEEIFGQGNFYLEIQSHPKFPKQAIANEGLIKIAKKLNIPLVATNDIHYVRKEDARTQDILLCIQTNRKVNESNRMNLMDFELYLKSPEEMATAFQHIPEAIDNTQKVAEQCNLEIKLGETQLPHYEVPAGYTPENYLRRLTQEGLQKRFGKEITREHLERMEYELGVIEKTGFASYFLIVQDFVNWAKSNGIVVGPGRGSAAGSFVSYLIGITNIDPIKYKLLFERFLNPERISMPDIDMDFADDRRDEVLEYVRKKYGNDHVAQIITFGTMAARAAIRDAGRALGLPYDFCDKTAKLIPTFYTIEKTLAEVKEFKDLYNSDPDAKKLIDSAQKLEGVVRHASMHACGVVITKDPVTEYTPLQNITGKGKGDGTVTQYSSSTKSSFVEKIGLLKMDFLGLKNLTIIQNTIRIVKKIRHLKIDINKIPMDDAAAYRLLQEARTTGVFQLESSGMKRYLKQLKPNQLEDIIAMVALYRPGPMDWIPDFIDRKHGRREIKYLHPKLEPILGNTYGVAVYQEQVMQIAQELAGFTLGEADVLRKAMGKKIMELIQEQKIKFIESCTRKGIEKKIAEKVFEFIEPFAGYGFNRSHAACYGLIGYQTAYLKANFPAEFMAALLTSDQDDIDRVAIEINECKELGIEVLPPDINESFEEFAVVIDEKGKERIRFGLNAIKNVGKTVAEEIVTERKRNGKYSSLADFLDRVTGKDLNKKSLEALIKVGALDEMGERNQLLTSIENILVYSKNAQRNKNSNQTSLFGDTQILSTSVPLLDAPPISKKEKLHWEKELIGLYLSDHPVAEFQEYFNLTATPIANISAEMNGNKISVGGVITKIQKINTKSKQLMLFITLEDTTGNIEILVFPKILERIGGVWMEEKVVLIEGSISNKDANAKVIADNAKEINVNEVEQWKRIRLTQKKNGSSKIETPENFSFPEKKKEVVISLPEKTSREILKKLSAYFTSCQIGSAKVVLKIGEKKIETPFCVKYTSEFSTRLKEILRIK